MKKIYLHFNGPFSFYGNNSLFKSEFSEYEGIYLWVIKDISINRNYIHYVGETINFGKRQREHFTQIIGLNYYILDAECAKRGIKKIIWNGMWRDKSENAVENLINDYKNVSIHLLPYIEATDIYFAPTSCEKQLRKHIEGCIGMNFREKYPELNTFYPSDNRIGRMKNMLNNVVSITSDEPIAGLDEKIKI